MAARFPQAVIGFLLTFIVGAAVGYLAGDHPTPAPSASTGRANASGNAAGLSRTAGEVTRRADGHDDWKAADALSSDADIASSILGAVHARDYFQRRHDIYELGQKLDRDTIRAAMDATQQFSETDRENAQYSLLARWLELDASAAYEWVGEVGRPSQRKALLREFFHSMGMKDPTTALAFLQRYQAEPKHGDDYTYSVIEAWSAHDPAGAVDAAMSLPAKEAKSSVNVALGRWAKSDPEGAMARAAGLPDAEMRNSARATVLREWAEEDAPAAANHALNMPAGKERDAAIASVVSGAAATDRDTAMRLIEQMPAGAARTSVLTQIINNLGYKEPQIAAGFVLALPPGQQRNSVHQVIHQFARQDRAAALEWAGQLSSVSARQSAMQQIMQQWSQDDPKSAAEYCVGNAMGTPEVIGQAVGNWAGRDANAALAWAGALADPAQREAALISAIGALGGSDPGQAAARASTMLTGPAQTQALSRIANVWATKDPAAAAAWAGTLTDPEARQSAATSISYIWARQDPAAAAAWVVQAPERSGALSTITREWAGQDPAAAAHWLETLAPGAPRDSALASFSEAVADADPEGAVAWAATIAQPQQRDNAISNAFYQWKRTDPKSASAWLRASPAISDQAKARLLGQGN